MKWRNVPFPETHIAPLLLGVAVDFMFPRILIANSAIPFVLSIPLLLGGILIILGAVREAGSQEVDEPTVLITSGPYAWSRNPMYVAWTLIYIGAICIINSVWLLLLLPVALVLTHFVVLREEKKLEELFGDSYRDYRQNVRRYI
jgi:protein-S-isoprenylcysteine O-methyltransferase Ste14